MNKDITLLNFVNLQIQDKKRILQWRNSDNIRKWMFNSNKISVNEHFTFINSLKSDSTKLYFLVKKNNDYLGIIDFTKITQRSCYYGFYANPDLKIQGIGRILEKTCLDYAFNILEVEKLHLEVFKSNAQVKNLHRKNGFNITSEKIVSGQEVYCMELINTNFNKKQIQDTLWNQ